MSAAVPSDDVARFYCTKHSWRGKYRRVFSVGTGAITTLNPNTHEVTNQWSYSEFIDITPGSKASNEFVIALKKGKKSQNLTFSCDFRPDVLTEVLRFSPLFSPISKQKTDKKFEVAKYHWSETKVRVVLVVRRHCVSQVNLAGKNLVDYDYKDVEYMAKVADHPGAFIIATNGYSRLHMFLCENREEVMKTIQSFSMANLGLEISIRRDPMTHLDFQNKRLGKYSDDDSITSITEFTVQKHQPRHSDPVQRIFALSETCIVERDPATYAVASIHPLCNVFALVRYVEDPQRFSIEYSNGKISRYTATDRDALLCSILDGVRASGNRDVCVKMRGTKRGQRLGPLNLPVEEEVESQYLRYIVTLPQGVKLSEAVERFNSNVAYSGLNHAVTAEGLFAENKEKLINGALTALLSGEGTQKGVSSEELEGQFHALRRLVASKAGFEAFTNLPNMREIVGKKVVKALRLRDDGISHACVDFLCALMQPMHDNYDLRREQLNKRSLLSSKQFLSMLLEPLCMHVKLGTGALVISALLDFFTFAICPPYSETTDADKFDMVLELVAGIGRVLFKLFQHPSLAIVKSAGLIMKSIIEEGDQETAAKMQELALAEGALPRHLNTSLFTSSTDNRLLTHRQLSRHLVSLWVTGNPTAVGLLNRILPLGLMQYLESDETVPENEVDRMHIRDNLKVVTTVSKRRVNKLEHALMHWKARLRTKQADPSSTIPITLRKRRENVKSEKNWKLFYYKFMDDHATSSLIWNYKTREELREALENEIRSFTVDKDLWGDVEISWNHVEFEVRYESLCEEIKIGDYYLRLLLDEGEEKKKFIRPQEFFNDLYHRFLLSPKPSMKAMCLQAMAIVYGNCFEEIGPFNDTEYIMTKMEECTDKTERDRLLMFIDKLLYHKKNIKMFLDSNGGRVLVDLMTMAHLHINRAYVPLQTVAIEASPDQARDTEREWYYSNKSKEKEGPYSFKEMKEQFDEGVIHGKTRCWAPGMEGWKTLDNIAQLKWSLVATGTSLLNESELAALILNTFIRICKFYPTRDSDNAVIRPLPRAKRMLSEANAVPHVVQLLLTFDPSLVEKVVILLNDIMEDNPLLPRFFQTGAFFFIMMYTGFNILPIAKFLKYAHTKQSFRPDDQQTSDIMQRSILGQLLPEAMVCYLENYGADKFSETFLGEFDTPEAIWNSEMRQLMIQKIASHISDFTPRLLSNTRATYQYCAMPVIQYPQLEYELFCNIYYLRHLCDQQKFPNWPIKEPVKLLKDVLEEWKKEVDKKPPEMSIDQAYEALGLKTGVGGHEESVIRKAYFKMAQKYHPDKNPDGREIFEAVNKAYEFLCSKTAKRTEGPDPHRIVLLLQTQSILFKRYADTLRPYKYAGYPMLITTIERESSDDDLFSKSAAILTAASEVAFHTMNTSSLNAEELRRDNGIPALQGGFARCVNVLSHSSKPDEMAVDVCTHICRCYRVSAQFEGCREAIVEVPFIIKDLCRVLYYKNLPRLNCVAAQTVAAFACDEWLQTNLLHAGVLWHLILYVFQYDYTLDEGGVETSDETNQQEVANNLARLSIIAIAKLCGYSIDKDSKTPPNKTIQNVIRALFTPYLTKAIAKNTPNELLKLLNSNTENPYLVWDNRTRAELTKYLEEQQQAMIRTGESEDMTFGESFVFSTLKDELVIGEVYVRVYNEQPTFVLEDAKGFAACLLDFIGSNAQYLQSLMKMTASDVDKGQHADRLKHVEMSLESLYNVIHSNPGVEMQCIGHFKLLFSLLGVQGAAKAQHLALKVISVVTGNKKCVSNISDSNVLQYLLLVLYMLPTSQELVLEVFQALTSHTQIVKESIQKGALIYLLNMFCNSQDPTVREETAALLAKMITDKLVGPKVRIVLSKFLPLVFMDAMRDNSEASVHMFENSQENPELIWNDEAREKVSGVVAKMTKEFFIKQKDEPETLWRLPEDFAVVYSQVQGEVVVGGVFLRLFIAQPTWVLRKPKEFLIALLEKFGQLIQASSPDGEELETVTTACMCLFTAHKSLADQVPPLGHIPRILARMKATNEAIPKACLQVVCVLADSEVCARTMSKCDTVVPLMYAMKKRRDVIHTAAETIKKLYDLMIPELVEQAVNGELVPYLLQLLESPLVECDKPSATKALIAESLKAMTKDLALGEKINDMLEASSVWKVYKDQKHDLFLSDNSVAGYLTGPTGVAGYLTAGTSSSSNAPLTAPPPLSPPDDTAPDSKDD